MEVLRWFRDLKNDDVDIAGGKGASLGEMYNVGLPVPPGFVVTAQTYKFFIQVTGIQNKIEDLLKNLDVENNEELNKVSKQVQVMILAAQMPSEIKHDIADAYDSLNVGSGLQALTKDTLSIIKTGRDSPYVAVRSSATAEDLPSASFAGQMVTYVNVKGAKKVIEAVQKCWASLFTARAIYYRVKNNFDHSKVFIAVIIQRMVESEKAGVMFTVNPTTNKENEIMIEGAFGLGDAVVAGEVTPDNYLIDKKDFKIMYKKLGRQEWMYAKNDYTGETYKKDLSEEKGSRQKLTDDEIVKLAKYGMHIEKHYKKPMDVEWAIEGLKIFIVQARPITTLNNKIDEHKEVTNIPILTGMGASPGSGFGPVKKVNNLDDIENVLEGDILVAKMTSPDYVPAMRKAKAIVTDEGGMTSHASIVSRELGIACVVGTGNAMSVLHDGQLITVDGSEGKVYEGKVDIVCEDTGEKELIEKYHDVKTKTKVYMNLGEPEKIDAYKDLPFEGIGLMRIEFIVVSDIKRHPLSMIQTGDSVEFISKLAEGIEKVARTIAPRPMIVRFSDFKTNEYKHLEGGEEFEPEEENPMIGWRGVSRYVSSEFKEAFKMECKAIKKLRDAGYKNVHVMLPFVRNVDEVKKVLEIMKEEELVRNSEFKIYLMAEVPSVAFIPEEFAKLDIDGASIGSNDLTQLVLGVDRDSSKLGKMGYFNERNEAVKKAMASIIKGFHKNGKTVGICGQAPSEYPEIAEFLVNEGIDSVSVNPDVVEKTHAIVARLEKG